MQEIRSLIDAWALWRDGFEWERLATLWHEGGEMATTTFAGPFEDFLRLSREASDRGLVVTHLTGGSVIDVSGDRGIAQTRTTFMQRAEVHDVPCDIVCIGRFYDFLEQRDGRWGFVLRQPVYERDRLDPIDPTATVTLDPELLERFPEGYRHLAYAQTKMGLEVRPGLPGLRGPEVEALAASGRRWLEGSKLDRMTGVR